MSRKKKVTSVKCKVLKIMCGPDGGYKPGDPIYVDSEKLDDLIAANAVELDDSEDHAKAVRKVRKRSAKSKAAETGDGDGEGDGEGGEGDKAGPRTNKS